MWKVLPYILFITIRQITKLQQLLCYTQKKLPLAININMYKCSLKVHTWEQYGFGEAELLLTKCTVVLVATSWWPDYNCLKKCIWALCEETITVFESSFKSNHAAGYKRHN